jgi:hypothetical protein
MDEAMYTKRNSSITNQAAQEIATNLKPALASINTAREYIGGPSRAKFYADILPLLETIKFNDSDKRRWVVVASIDRLIEARRTAAVYIPTADSNEHAQAATGRALHCPLPDQDTAERRTRRARDLPGGRDA